MLLSAPQPTLSRHCDFSADLVTLLVSLLQQCRYWSRHKTSVWLLCTFTGFCRCTSHWAVCSLSSHTTCCFFSVRQREMTQFAQLEPAWLRDTGAVHGPPGITTHMTRCAGLVRKKIAWKIQMSYWSGVNLDQKKVKVFTEHFPLCFPSAVMVIWNDKCHSEDT